MIKVENYPNAYREVYEILKLVPKEDLNKIPAEFLQIVKKNMNKNYDFSINLDIDFVKEQEILYETKAILAYVYLNYWATEDEKRIIRAKFKKDIEEAENKKREIYGTDVFKKIKANSINEEINAKVVEYKENIWIFSVDNLRGYNSFFNFLPNCIAMISAININPVKNTTINSFSGYGIKSCSILDVKCALISYPIIQVPSLKIILS